MTGNYGPICAHLITDGLCPPRTRLRAPSTPALQRRAAAGQDAADKAACAGLTVETATDVLMTVYGDSTYHVLRPSAAGAINRRSTGSPTYSPVWCSPTSAASPELDSHRHYRPPATCGQVSALRVGVGPVNECLMSFSGPSQMRV